MDFYTNPNYASVRCSKPLPKQFRITDNSQYKPIASDDNPLCHYNCDNNDHYFPDNVEENFNFSMKQSKNKSFQNEFYEIVELKKQSKSQQSNNENANNNHNKPQHDTEEQSKLCNNQDNDGTQQDSAHNDNTKQDPANESSITRWKKIMRNFLHSKPVHIAVIVLVIIDCILVITEIILDLYLDEENKEGPAPMILHYMSIAILSVFMVEVALKLFADYQHFIHHKMEVFDAFVVVISFSLDIAVLFFTENEALAALGLFVILRLWRIVRIVNGIILSSKAKSDERVHALKSTNHELEEKLELLDRELELYKKEVTQMSDLLKRNGIAYEVADISKIAQDQCTLKDKETRVKVIMRDENLVTIA